MLVRLLFILLLVSSCFSKRIPKEEKAQLSDIKLKEGEIIIGAFALSHISNPQEENSVNYGGRELTDRYISTIKEIYPNNSLILSAQESEISEQLLNKFDAINLTPNLLREFIEDERSETKLPLITSNIFELKRNSVFKRKGISSYKSQTVAGKRIAILALSTKKEVISGMSFDDPSTTIMKMLLNTKVKKHEHIIALLNIDTNCYNDQCPETDPLFRAVSRLPFASLSAVFNSSNQNYSGEINGIPILSFNKRTSFGMLTLSKTPLIKKNILKCDQFFKITRDCFLNKDALLFEDKFNAVKESNFKKIEVVFLNEKI